MKFDIFRAAVMGAALMSAPALAQTTTPAPAPSPPTAAAPAAPAPVTPAPHMTEQKMGQWLASKMPGVDVYNAGAEKIGDISDMLLDKDGKVEAVIISVGGFLGIGKHDVAVPINEVKWVEEAPRAAAPPNPPTPTSPTTSTAPRTEPTTTGTVPEGPRAYPYRAIVNMTAEQLKAAPAFKYAK